MTAQLIDNIIEVMSLCCTVIGPPSTVTYLGFGGGGCTVCAEHM